MAHSRAVARPPSLARWLLVPVALTLDATTALYFAGYRHPLGLSVPDAVLFVAPLLVYGGLAFLAFWDRPLLTRLAVLAVLLALHVGLVGLHALCFAGLWALPARAAVQIAHRWSPLVPLLQLIWVPILASPLASLVRQVPVPRARQRGSWTNRRGDRTSTATGPGHRARPWDREPMLGPRGPAVAPVVERQNTVSARPEPGSRAPEPAASPPELAQPARGLGAPERAASRREVALPEVGSRASESAGSPREVAQPEPGAPEPAAPLREIALPEAGSRAPEHAASLREVPPAEPGLPTPEPVTSPRGAAYRLNVDTMVRGTPAVEDTAPNDAASTIVTAHAPAEPSPVAAEVAWSSVDLPPISVDWKPPAEPVVAVAEAVADTPESEPSPAMEPTLVLAIPEPPLAVAAPLPVELPLDLSVVTRVFEPFRSLLSRDGTLLVEWTPGLCTPVVCVAPLHLSRERVVHLADRLARVLSAADAPWVARSVRRLSLRGPDGVLVLTLLDGAMLIAATSRSGALGLLEVLSIRVLPDATSEARAGAPGAEPGHEVPVPGAVHVETAAATLDVLAPSGVDAQTLGELAGRLLAAIADDGHDPARYALAVDLGASRLMLHPVRPDSRPPRFSAVVGRGEPPGLLGRRAERAARTLRQAS